MDPYSFVIPIVSAGAGAGAGAVVSWLTTRHQWKQTIRKERLEAARKIVSLVTKAQFAIAEEMEVRCSGNDASFEEIDDAKAALLATISDSRLLLGEDIYRRLGGVLEAIDRDMDCLDDDGWYMVGFTWRALEALIPSLGALVPGLRFQAPKERRFEIISNRLIPYGEMPVDLDASRSLDDGAGNLSLAQGVVADAPASAPVGSAK